ncbi:MAG: EAL domain-containing protein [Gammaproteobacteria bacterium]
MCFEITETAAVQNLQNAVEFIKQGQEMGCPFSLDDFGSGLSSFAYLKYFPVNYLKIDGGFVRDMATDNNDRVLVAAINEIGHIMGMRTIAEWVETDEVLDSLRALQVDYVQGSAIGKPIPLDRSLVVGL